MENQSELQAKELFETMLTAAAISEPLTKLDDGREFALIPQNFSLQDVSDPNLLPPSIAQAITVDDRNSLTAYANRFSTDRSLILADYDAGKITAKLDWHQNNENNLAPQPNSHSATLLLRPSEEYKRWQKVEGELHSQQEFALFMEENVADVQHPDAATMLEICRELEATQGASFKSGVRLDNGDKAFTYENETKVKNDMAIPTKITLAIPLYQGEEPTTITANFRFRVRPDGLFLGFQWHRVEYQRQAKFNEVATAAAEETGLPVFFGRTS